MLTAYPEELKAQVNEVAVRRLLRLLPALALFVLAMDALLYFLPDHFRFVHGVGRWSYRFDEIALFRIYKAELLSFGAWAVLAWGACRLALPRPSWHRGILNACHALLLLQCAFSAIIEQLQGLGGIFDIAIGCFVVPMVFALSIRRYFWTTLLFLLVTWTSIGLHVEDRVRFVAFMVKSGLLAGIAMILHQRIQRLGLEVYRMICELERQNERLTAEASHDPLTGLANRRAFEERYREEWERAQRYGHHFCLLAVDIDFFKRINDAYGHDAGDRVLKAVGELLRAAVRSTDLPARTGGEEFLVLLPGTGILAARILGERLRENVAALALGAPFREAVTASFGVASSEELGDEPDASHALLRLADRRLYAAKHAGRNRVVCPNVYEFD